MARAQVPFYSLNAGEIDQATVNRIDLEKLRMAADRMVNWTPTVRGPMTMRPGTKYLGSTRNDGKARLIPFVFNASTTSLLEVTDGGIRIFNDDELVTLPAYTAQFINPSFDSPIGTGWTDASTTGASALTAGGDLVLRSTNYSYARVRQSVSIPSGETAILHFLRVNVLVGPVVVKVGRTAGAQDILTPQKLDTGVHFLAFTPGTTTVHVQIEANEKCRGERRVASVYFAHTQTMVLPVPWKDEDLNNLRYAQSGDVIFVACKGYQPYKIERRGPNSWGASQYKTTAGPYLQYGGSKVRLKASASTGMITLTSDQPLFTPEHVGMLFEMTYGKQRRTEIFTATGNYTQPIKVTGVGSDDRRFSFSGTFSGSGTVRVERAIGAPDNWKPVTIDTGSSNGMGYGTASFSATGSYSFEDNDSDDDTPELPGTDNVAIYYRLYCSSISGSISVALTYDGGTSQTGIVRITGYTNSTTVTAEVVSELGTINEWTEDWRQGAFGDATSWPSAVAFHDGRLWWAGLDKVYGSVSDDFTNFDPNTLGDSGPIVRSVALGPVEGIQWMLPSQRLLLGTASSEVSIRSSSIDEPITPTRFTARNCSTLGSANIAAVAVDSIGIFVQRNKTRVFQLAYDVQINDYNSSELTRLNQDICAPGVTAIAVQRQPDTRVFFVKEDGTIAMLLYSRQDEVVGWARMETDGAFESICALPTGEDDDIYVVVRRTANGETKRYLEKFATTSELGGGNGTFLMDSIVTWSAGAPTTTITGITHLAGHEVVVYATAGGFQANAYQTSAFQTTSSVIIERHTVSSSGTITVNTPMSAAIIGLPYTARFKSVKLAYASQGGTALIQKKRVNHLGLLGINIATDGLRIGRDFDNMTKLANVYKGREIGEFEVHPDWDYEASSFGGKWDSDSRVCIENVSPYPATISGLVISMETNDRG